jgi:hypothetical protein
VPKRQGVFQKTIGKGRFAMIDVRYDAKIAYEIGVGHSGSAEGAKTSTSSGNSIT